MDASKISLELSLKEADILRRALRGYSPPKEDEVLSVMIYARIATKIKEIENKTS